MSYRLAGLMCLVVGIGGCCHQRAPCPPPPRGLPPGTIFPGGQPSGAVVPPAVSAPVPESPPPAWPPQAPPTPAVRNYPPIAAIAPPSNANNQEPPMAPQLGRPEPAVAEARSPSAASPALPAGISQFASAADRVASGLTPQADGWDWLKANGFQTVLFIRQPGEDETADRREVLQRGMKYQTLTYGPQTLSRQVVDEFSRLVGDPANQPLFVYDRNGVLAGSLWFLHFRTAGRLSDSEAQTRAGRLGLRSPEDAEQRTLWVAIQKLLSGQPR